MRIAVAIACALTLSAPLAAEDLPRPAFQFRDFTAGELVDGKVQSRCEDKGGAIKLCRRFDDKVAGVNALVLVYLYQQKLSRLIISSDIENYSALKAAFVEKYGSPCEQNSEPWESRGGLKLTRIVTTWCFKTGKLWINSIGSDASSTQAFYRDSENDAPPPPSKVDF